MEDAFPALPLTAGWVLLGASLKCSIFLAHSLVPCQSSPLHQHCSTHSAQQWSNFVVWQVEGIPCFFSFPSTHSANWLGTCGNLGTLIETLHFLAGSSALWGRSPSLQPVWHAWPRSSLLILTCRQKTALPTTNPSRSVSGHTEVICGDQPLRLDK